VKKVLYIYPFTCLILLQVIFTVGCSETYYKVNLDADYYEGYIRGYLAGFDDGQSHINDLKVFTDDYSYAILLPPDWSISGGPGIIISSPHDSAYIAISYDHEARSVDENVNAEIDFVKNFEHSSDFTLISEESLTHHGFKARVVEYTWQDALIAGNIRYCKSISMMAGDGIHSVSFYVWQEHYDFYASIIDPTLDSFHPLWNIRLQEILSDE